MTQEDRDLLDIISKLTPAFVTLVIGVVAANIAWRQHVTARDKLRLDLFEKRFQVYESVLAVKSALLEGQWTQESIKQIREATDRSKLLFGDALVKRLEEFSDCTRNMYFLSRKLANKHHNDPDVPALQNEFQTLVDKVVGPLGAAIEKLFRPYLKFDK